MLLARFFGEQEEGFYVDVGAHHPFLFSNTQALYERGWRGINIDAMPGSMKAFRRYRPHDINLEAGVGGSSAASKFFVFNVPALNTFDEVLARSRNAAPFRIERVIEVAVSPLAQLLERHVPRGRAIDLLTVDVEGSDLAVLETNDWDAFRPRVVLVESYGSTLADVERDPAASFLRNVGYVPLAKTINTLMLVEGDASPPSFADDRTGPPAERALP